MTTKPDLRCTSPTLALLQTLVLLLNPPDPFLRSRLSFNLPQQSPHITSVQCCGGCSVHWRLFSTLGDNTSTVGIPSVLWRLFSTMGNRISTVGDIFSTVEGIQYNGEITSLYVGITSVQWGITSVLWKIFSIVGEEV